MSESTSVVTLNEETATTESPDPKIPVQVESSVPDIEFFDSHLYGKVVLQRQGFLKLPFEIRKQIYQLVLTSNSSNNNPRFHWPTYGFQHGLAPALLATCKQIHEEAGVVLYAENRFSFHHPSDACVFYYSLADQKLVHLVDHVDFHADADSYTAFWRSYIVRDHSIWSLQHIFKHVTCLTVNYKGNWWHPGHTPEPQMLTWFNHPKFRDLVANISHVISTNCHILFLGLQDIPFDHFDYLLNRYTKNGDDRANVSDWERNNPTLAVSNRAQLQGISRRDTATRICALYLRSPEIYGRQRLPGARRWTP